MNELMKTIFLHKSQLLVFSALLTVGLTVSPACQFVTTQVGLVFAQDSGNKAREKEKNGSSDEHIESETKIESKSKKNDSPSGTKSKPLKRFVPSEEIDAEQAVDFPYDI
jgi:hypothetical protein